MDHIVGAFIGFIIGIALVAVGIPDDALHPETVNGRELFQQYGGDKKFMQCEIWNPDQ